MKILELKARNVKRLSLVEIAPDGHVVDVVGPNGAGKTSLLDSVMYTLAGKKSRPAVPLRRGEKDGEVMLKLDGDEAKGLQPMTVTWKFDENGRESLKIRNADGYEATSPQAILDGFCGRIAFDPLEFTRQKPKQQIETLKSLVGLDFTEADKNRKVLFDERTTVNRDVKGLQARLDVTTTYDDAPAKEVSVADLSVELNRRIEVNRQEYDACSKLAAHKDQCVRLREVATAADVLVSHLQGELVAAQDAATNSRKLFDDDLDAVARHHRKVDAMQREDTDEIQTQISTAEDTNRQVRANQSARELEEEHQVKALAADSLTERIDDIDADKARQMAGVAWPIPGLGFDENGATFGGFPFVQASSAEQLRVSVAMGFALNPTLRVLLIRDGSLLDNGNLEALAKLAEENDGQLWIERVGDGGESSVVIEDGRVRADTPEPEAATT